MRFEEETSSMLYTGSCLAKGLTRVGGKERLREQSRFLPTALAELFSVHGDPVQM